MRVSSVEKCQLTVTALALRSIFQMATPAISSGRP
jgi:hypothetical protein